MHRKVYITLIFNDGNPHSWRIIAVDDFLFFYSDCQWCIAETNQLGGRCLWFICVKILIKPNPPHPKQPSFKWCCGTKQMLFTWTDWIHLDNLWQKSKPVFDVCKWLCPVGGRLLRRCYDYVYGNLKTVDFSFYFSPGLATSDSLPDAYISC